MWISEEDLFRICNFGYGQPGNGAQTGTFVEHETHLLGSGGVKSGKFGEFFASADKPAHSDYIAGIEFRKAFKRGASFEHTEHGGGGAGVPLGHSGKAAAAVEGVLKTFHPGGVELRHPGKGDAFVADGIETGDPGGVHAGQFHQVGTAVEQPLEGAAVGTDGYFKRDPGKAADAAERRAGLGELTEQHFPVHAEIDDYFIQIESRHPEPDYIGDIIGTVEDDFRGFKMRYGGKPLASLGD